VDGLGAIEADREWVAGDVQEPARICAAGGTCEALGGVAREKCAGQQRGNAADDGVDGGARTETLIEARCSCAVARHGRCADRARDTVAAAQNIAMRRGRVMVISCPTPAIGIFLKHFHAPGSSGGKPRARELPGEERET